MRDSRGKPTAEENYFKNKLGEDLERIARPDVGRARPITNIKFYFLTASCRFFPAAQIIPPSHSSQDFSVDPHCIHALPQCDTLTIAMEQQKQVVPIFHRFLEFQ